MEDIKVEVNNEASRFGIEVVDIRIRRADLPEANSQAIYERMISERVREAKEFRAKGSEIAQKIRAEADKERTVILAEATKKSEITEFKKSTFTGAITKPTKAVKITSDITLGFISS